MANLIPSLNSCLGKMTAGEKRFARRLEQFLEDDYLCWYEPRIGLGVRQRYTDFIVVHPWRSVAAGGQGLETRSYSRHRQGVTTLLTNNG
ncbi:MAG: hypothetical protein R3E89_05675 [Thiolinea sp.]